MISVVINCVLLSVVVASPVSNNDLIKLEENFRIASPSYVRSEVIPEIQPASHSIYNVPIPELINKSPYYPPQINPITTNGLHKTNQHIVNSISNEKGVKYLQNTYQNPNILSPQLQQADSEIYRRDIPADQKQDIYQESSTLHKILTNQNLLRNILAPKPHKKRFILVYPNGTIGYEDNLSTVSNKYPNHIILSSSELRKLTNVEGGIQNESAYPRLQENIPYSISSSAANTLNNINNQIIDIHKPYLELDMANSEKGLRNNTKVREHENNNPVINVKNNKDLQQSSQQYPRPKQTIPNSISISAANNLNNINNQNFDIYKPNSETNGETGLQNNTKVREQVNNNPIINPQNTIDVTTTLKLLKNTKNLENDAMNTSTEIYNNSDSESQVVIENINEYSNDSKDINTTSILPKDFQNISNENVVNSNKYLQQSSQQYPRPQQNIPNSISISAANNLNNINNQNFDIYKPNSEINGETGLPNNTKVREQVNNSPIINPQNTIDVTTTLKLLKNTKNLENDTMNTSTEIYKNSNSESQVVIENISKYPNDSKDINTTYISPKDSQNISNVNVLNSMPTYVQQYNSDNKTDNKVDLTNTISSVNNNNTEPLSPSIPESNKENVEISIIKDEFKNGQTKTTVPPENNITNDSINYKMYVTNENASNISSPIINETNYDEFLRSFTNDQSNKTKDIANKEFLNDSLRGAETSDCHCYEEETVNEEGGAKADEGDILLDGTDHVSWVQLSKDQAQNVLFGEDSPNVFFIFYNPLEMDHVERETKTTTYPNGTVVEEYIEIRKINGTTIRTSTTKMYDSPVKNLNDT